MLFISNKYTTVYFKIISAAQIRDPLSGYVEKHHIIPKSLGGTNSKDNIVALSAREHFICHWLLTKMTADQYSQFKMCKAFVCMLYMDTSDKRYKISGKMFENIKKRNAKIYSDAMKGSNNPMYGKEVSDETKQKLSISNTGKIASDETRKKISNALKGRTFSEESKQRMSNAKKGKYKRNMNPMYGVLHSEETKLKISEAALARPKVTCEHCSAITSLGNHARWHGNNCKLLKK